jgi:hypothetical protein
VRLDRLADRRLHVDDAAADVVPVTASRLERQVAADAADVRARHEWIQPKHAAPSSLPRRPALSARVPLTPSSPAARRPQPELHVDWHRIADLALIALVLVVATAALVVLQR